MALSAESAKLVEAIENQITELHTEWKMLLQLFGVSREQSEFLKEVAGGFFETVYNTFVRDILLGIARLTDPCSTHRKDNLVLKRLTGLAELRANPELLAKVTAKLADVNSKVGAIRDYRHKSLAHLDLVSSLEPGSDVLPGITRQDIDTVLKGFEELLHLVELNFRGTSSDIKKAVLFGGAEDLLSHLKDARSWRGLPQRAVTPAELEP